MKSIFQEINKYTNNFKKYWLQYIALFIGVDLFTQVLIIPLFRYLTTAILEVSAIPFISYQNIITIISTRTLMFLCLILELIVLFLVVYGEFSLILLGVREISQGRLSSRALLKELWQSYRSVRISSVLLLVVYFLLIVPFADLVYQALLLAKVQIPEFILGFMTQDIWLVSGLIVFYLLTFVLGIRLILTLPITICQRKEAFLAMKESWELTSHKYWWKILSHLLVLGLSVSIILLIFNLLICLCQLGLNHLPRNISFSFAVFDLLLVQLVSELVAIWISVVPLLIVVAPLKSFKLQSKVKETIKPKMLALCLVLVFAPVADTNNILYLGEIDMQRPLTISHRGVSNEDGVQNTIPALKKTARLHPDYVEIDLHETKDKRFVVIHDKDLKQLTGISKTPKDLTLKQLTRITLRGGGHQAEIASFGQYLKAVAKIRQKLLVGAKTTPNDSLKMLQGFNKKYGKLIIKRKCQVQSSDYKVIEGLHQINPKLFALYVQPYNFTYPQNATSGYSMEYSILSNDFIWQAQLQNKPVYAWAVNTPNMMVEMMYDNMSGIITDQLTELDGAIKDFRNNRSYTNKLLNFILILPDGSAP